MFILLALIHLVKETQISTIAVLYEDFIVIKTQELKIMLIVPSLKSPRLVQFSSRKILVYINLNQAFEDHIRYLFYK